VEPLSDHQPERFLLKMITDDKKLERPVIFDGLNFVEEAIMLETS